MLQYHLNVSIAYFNATGPQATVMLPLFYTKCTKNVHSNICTDLNYCDLPINSDF